MAFDDSMHRYVVSKLELESVELQQIMDEALEGVPRALLFRRSIVWTQKQLRALRILFPVRSRAARAKASGDAHHDALGRRCGSAPH